jgi:hypothetical protein
MEPDRQVLLRFGNGAAATDGADLSAVVCDGDLLWVAGDEAPLLHRFTRQDGGSYGAIRTFPLDVLAGLEADAEIDVEGMDRAADDLWLVGSHSRTRKEPDADDDDRKVLEKLATVRERRSRNVVIRLPLEGEGAAAHPVGAGDGGRRTVAVLDGDLLTALATDEHLAPFLPLPGKDGGLDIEGLVALDGVLLLGLRGPVLRGWAVVLEVRLRTDPDDAGRLRLDAAGGPGYRSIVLDLDGLGVRDLCRVGDDVLVLAGPTMALDGPFRLYRWSGAVAERQRVVRSSHLTRLAELPSGRGADEGLDHPEGVAPLGDDPDAVLVVYDSPAPGRLSTARTVLADVFPLDPRRSLAEPIAGEVPCPSAP